jgi:sporulation protein YlmC with PRC-barrel domain
MEKYCTHIIGLPVVTESGHKIARVYDIVLNTDTGKVVGFLTSPSGQKVLAPIDILHFGNALSVHDEESILDSDEIHAVAEAFRKGIHVMRKRVVTKSGEYLGQVIDYAINDKMFVMTKIVVGKTIFGLINYGMRLIAHKDIIEIKKDRIIVKDPLRLEPIKATTKLRVDTAPSG